MKLIIGAALTVLFVIGLLWGLYLIWDALAVHGMLGIVVFLIFLCVASPILLSLFVLALIPLIVGVD